MSLSNDSSMNAIQSPTPSETFLIVETVANNENNSNILYNQEPDKITKQEEIDQTIVVNEEDEENFANLTEWMIKNVEIVPSIAKKYSQIFLTEGVGSVSRLKKRLMKNESFLTQKGIRDDDAEEIILTIRREAKENSAKSVATGYVTPSSHEFFSASKHVSPSVAPAPQNAGTLSLDTLGVSDNYFGANKGAVSEGEMKVLDALSSRSPARPTIISSRSETLIKLRKLQMKGAKQPSAEALNEARFNIENLKNAIDMRMEAAIIGQLNAIIGLVVGKADVGRAFFKEGIAEAVIAVLSEFTIIASICERALQVIGVLCRSHDENKANTSIACAENAKALGEGGAPEAISFVLLKHANEAKLLEVACDAVRGLCILPSNRARLGNAGVCETIARALGMKKFVDSVETCSWICRAIGHLAYNNQENQERLGNVGSVETTIAAMSIHVKNSGVCTETCWAIRQMAPWDSNRSRITEEFGPETVVSILKERSFYKDENFVLEACKALTSFISSEDDEVIQRLVLAGAIPILVKSLKKHPESDALATEVYHLFYYISCDDTTKVRLTSSDQLELLSLTLETHAGVEGMAEWGCRTVHNLVSVDGVVPRMKSAGMCEMVVSCVQRQAISAKVCGLGCLAIGDLAMDKNNHDRLTDSGACEAVVASLKRHYDNTEDENENGQLGPDVVFQTCHAIHYLAQTDNNTAWIGANGGCEAVTLALAKHTMTSVNSTRSSLRALGSLAYNDEGNQLRFHSAGACAVIVTAIKTHGMDPFTAEYGFRAIYNLSAENANVSELGSKGACGLVVAGLKKHLDHPKVLTQACFATYGLAVKVKSDKVHTGNTRKLVEKGVIESVIVCMKKYPLDAELQKAGSLAIASLARLAQNRESLGASGAIGVVLSGFSNHSKSEDVIPPLVTAVDRMCQDSDINKTKFIKGEIIDILLNILSYHEKCAAVVGECLRALVNLSSVTPCPTRIRSDNSFKLYVRCLRLHDKIEVVAQWGSNLIYTSSVDEKTRSRLGEMKACEAIIAVLQKHGANNTRVAMWACRALVALSMHDPNKLRFVNSETCSSTIKALEAHQDDAASAEWICAAIVSLATNESNRLKLGGACSALCQLLKHLANTSEIVTRLACEAIYELCIEESHRHLFAIVGACDLLVNLLTVHLHHASTAQQICRAISGLAKVSPTQTDASENSSLLGTAGGCQAVVAAIKAHSFSSIFVEWGCAAVAALSHRNPTNQSIFFSMVKDPASNIFKTIVFCLNTHKASSAVCYHACRAVRALCHENDENSKELSHAGIIPVVLRVLKIHTNIDYVVEHSCWILAHVIAPDEAPEDESHLLSSSSSDLYAMDAANPISANISTSSTINVKTATMSASSVSIDVNQPMIQSADMLSSLSPSIQSRAIFASPSYASKLSPNCKQLYKEVVNWEILLNSLQANYQKQLLARWICAAVSVFAEYGHLSHGALCDAVMTTLTRHIDKEIVIMRALHAIGKLGEFNAENKIRFARGQALEIIDRVLNTYTEGESVSVGIFTAVAGLAKDSATNQAKFSAFPNMCKQLVKLLYSEIESEQASLWGCAAISALALKNPGNQVRLSSACNYMADIIDAHYKSPKVAKEACRTVSILAHGNITNRNKLGAAEACAATLRVLFHYSDDRDITIWAIRAIADLAANNPNNQTKLGSRASEGLVNVLRRIVQESGQSALGTPVSPMVSPMLSLTRDETPYSANATLAKWTCWAIGNIVQLGKGQSMVIEESPANRGVRAFVRSEATAKNTYHLNAAGAADLVLAVINLFIDDSDVVQWATRAVNNLAKSRALRSEFISGGTVELLTSLSVKYEGNKEVSQWIKLATETLQLASSGTSVGSGTMSPLTHSERSPHTHAVTGTDGVMSFVRRHSGTHS